jgi:hypothetical protein
MDITMANMTTDNGTRTPEQMAAEITRDMNTPWLIELPGTQRDSLATIVRYLNRDAIMARGEGWYKKNQQSLTCDTIADLVKARAKAITDYLAKKEQMDQDTTFRKLVARGTAIPEAYKLVYGEPKATK